MLIILNLGRARKSQELFENRNGSEPQVPDEDKRAHQFQQGRDWHVYQAIQKLGHQQQRLHYSQRPESVFQGRKASSC